jgi:5'(3')-deoxyribonucleotidase
MKIGIDFDAVILDSERKLKFGAEYWSLKELGKPKLKSTEVSQEDCFDWTDEERNRFYREQYDGLVEKCEFMPGANEIMKELVGMGHEFYIITLRGCFRTEEIESAKKYMRKMSVKPKQVLWGVWDKAAKCKELGLDIMIDDNPKNVDTFKGSNIEVLYLRDTEARDVKLKNVTTVYTWMQIYHEIVKRAK